MFEIAQELNAEFMREYREDPEFRRSFNEYLKKLGVDVVPETPQPTLKNIGEYPTRH